MTRVPTKVRLAAEEILKRRRPKVRLEQLGEGDIVEFSDLFHGSRFGRVYHLHPRARRVVVGLLLKTDYPHGKKWLERYVDDWRLTIAEAQVLSIYRKAVVVQGAA